MTEIQTLEKQIIGKVWTSPEIYANVEQLCDFGSRFVGTESERQARDFIQAKLKEYGLERVRLAAFDYRGWARGEAGLRVVEPRRKELPSAISLVYSPNTPAGRVRGPRRQDRGPVHLGQRR